MIPYYSAPCFVRIFNDFLLCCVILCQAVNSSELHGIKQEFEEQRQTLLARAEKAQKVLYVNAILSPYYSLTSPLVVPC